MTEKGSLEEEWEKAGYVVKWSEIEPRAYEVFRVGDEVPKDSSVSRLMARAVLPTVQKVDEWVKKNPSKG